MCKKASVDMDESCISASQSHAVDFKTKFGQRSSGDDARVIIRG